ncbi:hypothetical protein, partial [Nocardia brasiliensis]|uniref:hypothetical protein n=1 Tax=Nocardia brasiliensis TaxID=37326 RepID=UPI002453F420
RARSGRGARAPPPGRIAQGPPGPPRGPGRDPPRRRGGAGARPARRRPPRRIDQRSGIFP